MNTATKKDVDLQREMAVVVAFYVVLEPVSRYFLPVRGLSW